MELNHIDQLGELVDKSINSLAEVKRINMEVILQSLRIMLH